MVDFTPANFQVHPTLPSVPYECTIDADERGTAQLRFQVSMTLQALLFEEGFINDQVLTPNHHELHAFCESIDTKAFPNRFYWIQTVPAINKLQCGLILTHAYFSIRYGCIKELYQLRFGYIDRNNGIYKHPYCSFFAATRDSKETQLTISQLFSLWFVETQSKNTYKFSTKGCSATGDTYGRTESEADDLARIIIDEGKFHKWLVYIFGGRQSLTTASGIIPAEYSLEASSMTMIAEQLFMLDPRPDRLLHQQIINDSAILRVEEFIARARQPKQKS